MRFLRSNKDDQSYLGDIDVKSVDKVVEYKFRDIKFSNFSILEDPFEDESFNPADTLQEQLQKNPLPDFCILNSDVGEAIRVDRDCEDSDIEIFPEKRIIEDLELHTVLEKTNSGNSNLVEHIEPPKIEETKVSKVEKRKLTEFNYLLQRKGLRLMRKYYKDQFENFAQNYDYKKRVKKMLPNELNHIMSEYAQKEF